MGKKAEKKRLHKLRKSKANLVFDEDARKEWLTSFSKRKKERQEKAKSDLAALLKEEKVRQKEEFREKTKKLEAKYLEKIKDVEDIIKEKTEAYKCGDKTVQITEYNLVEQDSMLGINKDNEDEEDVEEKASTQDSDDAMSHTDSTDHPVPVTRMPKKMSNTAVRIEKRLFKLNNKRTISKHKANKKKQLMEASGKSLSKGSKGKVKSKAKGGRKKR